MLWLVIVTYGWKIKDIYPLSEVQFADQFYFYLMRQVEYQFWIQNYLIMLQCLLKSSHKTSLTSPLLTDPFFINSANYKKNQWQLMYYSYSREIHPRNWLKGYWNSPHPLFPQVTCVIILYTQDRRSESREGNRLVDIY